MATSHLHDTTEDFTVCPVCFEKYQTPRFLPCTHAFCHSCLSAHIKSSCRNCEPALGFHCPVCRVFVPAPGVLHQYPYQNWANRFPENSFLSACISKHASLTNNSCGPCGRDGEDSVKAESWCMECEDLLCEECCQNHRKYKSLQYHQIFPITSNGLDFSKSWEKIRTDIFDCCYEHEKRNIKFVCEAHQKGCCSVCVVNEHKHCEHIFTLSEAADMFSEKKKQIIVEEINKLSSRIETTIQKEKLNISYIDEKMDNYSEMLKQMIEEMVNRLKTLENKYMDCLVSISKGAKLTLEESVKFLEHRLAYLKHWLEIVSTDTQNERNQCILKCLKTNEVLEAIEDLPFVQLNLDLIAKIGNGIEMIDSLGTLFSVDIINNEVNLNDNGYAKVREKTRFRRSSRSSRQPDKRGKVKWRRRHRLIYRPVMNPSNDNPSPETCDSPSQDSNSPETCGSDSLKSSVDPFAPLNDNPPPRNSNSM